MKNVYVFESSADVDELVTHGVGANIGENLVAELYQNTFVLEFDCKYKHQRFKRKNVLKMDM